MITESGTEIQNGGKDSPGRPFYKKEELLRARQFSGQEDLVSALLKDQETYTLAMAKERISRFLKGKVN